MVFPSLEDHFPFQPREIAESGEVRAAMSALTLSAVRLTWSNRLNRSIAYLPDGLLAQSAAAAIESIRCAFGREVLVIPDSLRLP